MTDLYNPYGDMNSWYGVPNYGNNYANYMVSQTQPLTLNRIMSMVNDIQRGGQAPQSYGSQAVSMSQPMSQIPPMIANAIFDSNNRILSMPRMRFGQTGMDVIQPEQQPGGQPGSGIPVSGGSGGSGGGSGGGNYATGSAGGNVGGVSAPSYGAPTPPAPTGSGSFGALVPNDGSAGASKYYGPAAGHRPSL
jgi:hypothetical protein